jgi:hypothetical protein
MQKVVVLPHQSEYMQAPYLFPEKRWFFLVCGYGAGKTRANVIALLYAVKRLQAKKDRAGDYARIIVAGYTLAHLNKTFLVYLRQILNQSKTVYTENRKDNFFVIGTVTVFIIPMENPENIFGFESWAIFVEEIDELTEDKAIEAVHSLSERCRQQIPGERSPFLCFGSTSQGQKGLYRIYNHFKKSGTGFVLIRGRTQDNVFLPKGLIADMLRMYTAEEKRVFMDGEFLAIAKGRVLPDFVWERNYLEYDLDTSLRHDETVVCAMDFNTGYNRATAYIVRDGIIYCVKDYDFPNAQDAPSVFRHDFPNQRILWVPDVTMKDSFPQFGRELRKHGIHIIYRKKNPLVEDTVFLVNKLLYIQRLMFCRIAKNAAEACALAMRDKDNKVPKGIGPSSPIHYLDTVRYACAFIAMRDRDFLDIRRLIIEKRASFRKDSDRPVQDIGDGYLEVHPDALRSRKLLV